MGFPKTTFVMPWITLRSWTTTPMLKLVSTLCWLSARIGPDSRWNWPWWAGTTETWWWVHAMRMRAKYAHLWPRNEGDREP